MKIIYEDLHILRPVVFHYHCLLICFPGGSAVKNLPAVQESQETQCRSLSQEDPTEKEMGAH